MLHFTTIIIACSLLICANSEDCASELKAQICADSNRTCEECIRADACCRWVYEPSYVENRCSSQSDSVDDSVENVINAKPSYFVTLLDKDFTNMEDLDVAQEPIQIRPQHLRVHLRKGKPFNITLKYKAAQNYPLDLYYLMDLTHSMESHHKQMVTLGSRLKDRLLRMTSKYELGFGYYSDKVLMPFSTMTRQFLANPCHNEAFNCASGFNFKHALGLTTDFDEFMRKVGETSNHTANNDDLEGGFDAIMQILLCDRLVQWRGVSRKVIVVATDGFMHFAGDGLLAGIVARNNDNKCLLVKEVNSTTYLYDGAKFDYPSLEEVYRMLVKKRVNILFAVRNKNNARISDYYAALAPQLGGFSAYGLLKEDPKSILDLVEDAYMRIVRQVTFNVKHDSDNVKISFYSTCKADGQKGTLNETSSCHDIEVGKEYTFNIMLELKELPDVKQERVEIEEMNIEGLLKIDLVYDEVSCECKDEGEYRNGNHGRYNCGKYNCDSGWIGEMCDTPCDRNNGRFKNDTYTSTTCLQRGEFDEDTCECVCDKGYTGFYCENVCKRFEGRVCNDHGRCLSDGSCNCEPEYTGELCQCRPAACLPPKGGDACSGHGECKCGKCVCDTIDGKTYTGEYCQYCDGCPSPCELYNRDITTHFEIENDNLTQYEFKEVNNMEDGDIECLISVSKGDKNYRVVYTYEQKQDGTLLVKYMETEYTPVNMAHVGGGFFLLVVLILCGGLIIWKVTVSIKDAREVAKHNQNVRSINCFMENSTYVSPITEYRNPMLEMKNSTSKPLG